MKVLKTKKFVVDKRVCRVDLVKKNSDYIVEVDGVEYKKTPNELFAVQVFNAI